MGSENIVQTRDRFPSCSKSGQLCAEDTVEPHHNPLLPDTCERGKTDQRFTRGDGTKNRNPEGILLSKLVAEDFRTHGRDWGSPGFWTLFWHRVGNWRMGVWPGVLRLPFSLLYRIMEKRCQRRYGIMLPYTVRVGRRVKLEHFGGMIIVAQQIGDDVTLRHNTTVGIARDAHPEDRPVIENGANIGTGAVLLGAILIGRNAVVGANAVVTKDVPAYATARGVPAKIFPPRAEN